MKINRIGTPNLLRNDPEYGDLVVLIPPHNPVPYIKRLIGKPGDVIRIINKKIYVNGAAIDRKFIKSEDSIINRRFRYSSGEIVTREIDVVIDLYQKKTWKCRIYYKKIQEERTINFLKNGQYQMVIILSWVTIEKLK
ncbi:MAG: hypothetical protein Ct9H90mP22_3410 [Gammaproteobacteria bacterium]|nr:MAG: hypothetical protein Ct9H90mP22_3410 [Gammaproteobacteria bacterium]